MPLVSVRDPGPAGGATRTAGGVARAGNGPGVPHATPGNTGTIPVYTRSSVATPILTRVIRSNLYYQYPVLMPLGVNEWLCIIASSDFVSFTDLWWQRVSVHATTKQITLGAIGTLHYNEPLGIASMAGNALVLLSPANVLTLPGFPSPFGNSYVYFGVFNSTYTSLAVAKHDYASPDWWWTQSMNDFGYFGQWPYPSFATNDVAVVGMNPKNSNRVGDGQGALLCLNPHTGAVIDIWRTPVHSYPVMQANLYDAGHIFVMCGDAFAGLVTAFLVPFGPTGFGTATAISPPSGGWDTARMSTQGQPYVTQFIQNGYLGDINPLGQVGFSVVGDMVHLYSATQTYLQPLPAPYAGTVSDPTFAAQPYPSTSPSSWMLADYGQDPDGNQMVIYDRVASYVDGAGNMQANIIETATYPQNFVDLNGTTITNDPQFGASDSDGNFLTVPASNPEFYLWAGATATVQTGTRTARVTVRSNIYNNDFAYGSFPGWSWQSSFAARQATWACADLNGSEFTDMQFWFCDLSYANLTNCYFGARQQFQGETHLRWSCLAYADCTGTIFDGDPQGGMAFTQVDCTATIFRDCVFNNVQFYGGGFIGADFTGATFVNCSWDPPGAFGNDLTVFWDHTTKWPAGFDTTVFRASRSTYYDFSGQHLSGDGYGALFLGHANFENAVLTDFTPGSTCSWANFKGAQLLGGTIGTTVGNRSHTALFSWCNFQGSTIDFGLPAPFNNHGGWIYGLVAPHADFTGTQFIFPQGTADSAHTGCQLNGLNLAYAKFDGVKRPPGQILVIEECNAAWSSWVGADFGPTDRYLPGFAYTWCDTNFSYADLTDAQGGYYQSAQFSNAKLVNLNAPHSDLEEAFIGYADLSGAILSERGVNGSMTDESQWALRAPIGQGNTTNDFTVPLSLTGGGLYSGLDQTLVGVIYVPPVYGPNDPTSWSITPGSQNHGWETVAVYNNAATGGNGWLGLFQLKMNFAQFGPSPNDGYVNGSSTFTFQCQFGASTLYVVYQLIQWAHCLGFDDLGLHVGYANPTVTVPSAVPPSGQNGCNVLTVMTAPNDCFIGVPSFTDSAESYGVAREMPFVQYGGSAGSFLGGFTSRLSDSVSTGTMTATMGGASGLSAGPYLAVNLVTKAFAIPTLYNSQTVLPASVSKSWMWPAVTVQTDTSQLNLDGHEDFSYQTISPHVTNQGGVFDLFGADMNHCHFLGATYSLFGYNNNFQGSTFDRGCSIMNQTYQSHWGGSPTGAPRVPATAVGLPPRASKHGLVVVKSRVG